MMKDCPRLPLLKLMTELDNGGHVKSPLVSYLKVSSDFLVLSYQKFTYISGYIFQNKHAIVISSIYQIYIQSTL